MARRGQDFKIRLLDEEAADLDARAARDGLAKADVIRKAMGWAPVNLVKASPPAAGDTPPPPSPSAADGPGMAAASELARRIAARQQKG